MKLQINSKCLFKKNFTKLNSIVCAVLAPSVRSAILGNKDILCEEEITTHETLLMQERSKQFF